MKNPTEKLQRVVIADAHTLFRAGLRLLLEEKSRCDMLVVGEAGDGRDAVRQVLELSPDVLILDVVLPELDGLEVLRRLQPVQSVRKILLTAAIAERHVTNPAELGLSGIVSKEASWKELLRCLEATHAGAPLLGLANGRSSTAPSSSWRQQRRDRPFRLTDRETEILKAIVEGCTNPEIAKQLLISEQTVKHHVTNLFNKTGASNRLELVLFATEKKLVDISRSRIGGTPIDVLLGRKRSA